MMEEGWRGEEVGGSAHQWHVPSVQQPTLGHHSSQPGPHVAREIGESPLVVGDLRQYYLQGRVKEAGHCHQKTLLPWDHWLSGGLSGGLSGVLPPTEDVCMCCM